MPTVMSSIPGDSSQSLVASLLQAGQGPTIARAANRSAVGTAAANRLSHSKS